MTDTVIPDGPAHGSPEWHAREAEVHLGVADKLAAQAENDPGAESAIVRRLLAATANAQLGALKLGLRQDGVLDQLYELRRITEYTGQTASNTSKPRPTGY